MKNIRIFVQILHFLNLEPELENPDIVYEEIKKGVVFKGTNLWILFFSIVIASVGLNMNSTAVVIGAMLISPLLGPINGMGYSIATYDLDLFRTAVKNFTFAILVGLAGSTTYFALSPISTAHSELLARTSPTIYDVIIALFGGLAGIVAISSKQKGNVIPGVAIATALMPPLCTAGYGLATLQFNFFLGALYLFTINTIFIALASVLISQLLKFPIRSIVDDNKRRVINRAITFVILLVLLPSIFFGYKLVKEEKFIRQANQYISNISNFEGNYLLKSDINPKKNQIILVYGGTTLSEEQKDEIIRKSKDFFIEDAEITIEQGLTFAQESSNLEILKLKEQILNLNALLIRKNNEIDSIVSKQKFGNELLKEIKTIYPQINNCFYSESITLGDSLNQSQIIPVVVLSSNKRIAQQDRVKIDNWLRERLKNDKVKIFYE